MTVYKLINRVGSGGFVVEAALALAGASYEVENLDSAPGSPLPDSFRSLNPRRQVPVLILPDGTMMTESAAMLIHLAACFPDRGLAPLPATSAHATFLRWVVFASVNLYEPMLRRIYPARFTTDLGGIDAVREAAVQASRDGFEIVDRAAPASGFFLGGPMSVLDVYLAMLFVWFRADVDAPRLAAITDAVSEHPTIAPLWVWRRAG